jgi:hypothetical protein
VLIAFFGVLLRSCEHCFFERYNLGLDSLWHLCRCACVQDFADFESFENLRFESGYYTKHVMAVRSSGTTLAHNR